MKKARLACLLLTLCLPSLTLAEDTKETVLKCHDFIQITLPGEWTVTQVPPRNERGFKLSNSHARSPHGAVIIYTFEPESEKLSELTLESIPDFFLIPMGKKLEPKGYTSGKIHTEPLHADDKNRLYFSVDFTHPEKGKIPVTGIVIRTEKAIYALQQSTDTARDKASWQELMKTFKEG